MGTTPLAMALRRGEKPIIIATQTGVLLLPALDFITHVTSLDHCPRLLTLIHVKCSSAVFVSAPGTQASI